mmetsp:Transcript_32821/g.65053  ORF Transcript_32821/g.65053 Transcript_32821/m.65053 type:complete len:287 (-) Transcript_32821:167-1027(-)
MHELDRLSSFNRSGGNAGDSHLTLEVVVIDIGDETLEILWLDAPNNRRIDSPEDGVEQGPHIVLEMFVVVSCLAQNSRREDRGEIRLFVACIELHEKVEHLVDDPVRTGGGTVDLVDHHEDFETLSEGLVEYKAGLGLRTLDGVHHKEDPIAHVEDAFDLATEIRVAGSIHNINLKSVSHDGEILSEDGDSSLPFLVVTVHDADPSLIRLSIIAKDSGLTDQGIYKGGLAVVDVGNYSDVADFALHGKFIQGFVNLTHVQSCGRGAGGEGSIFADGPKGGKCRCYR